MKDAPQDLLFYLALVASAVLLIILFLIISWISPLLVKVIVLAGASSLLLVFLFGQGREVKGHFKRRLRNFKEECRLRQEGFLSER